MNRRVLLLIGLLFASTSVFSTFELEDPAQAVGNNENGEVVAEEGGKVFHFDGKSKRSAINLAQADYLKLIVGNYVHGFKELDTSVKASDDSVQVGVYYGTGAQEKQRAEQLAERFRQKIPHVLDEYKWTKGVTLIVYVYDKNRLK